VFEHAFPFDPTYGYDLTALLAIKPPEPVSDFEAFWRDTYRQTLAVAPELEMEEDASRSTETRQVYKAYFTGLGGFRCGAWVTIPRGQKVVRAVIESHGYGGRDTPADLAHGEPAVVFAPVARGFGISSRPEIPNNSKHHVVYGIESRETYIHRFCVTDIWSAISAVLEKWPELRGKVEYSGGSFGGGIGAMAIPWDDRIVKGFLDVPSFGNHPLRVTMQCTGSGQAVLERVAQEPELLTTVLPYYDAAVSARFIRVPTLVAPALFDPSVPPPGQFSVYNAIPEAYRRLHVKTSGHFVEPNDLTKQRLMLERRQQWAVSND
jgi:cephalosporin-C deacetylase